MITQGLAEVTAKQEQLVQSTRSGTLSAISGVGDRAWLVVASAGNAIGQTLANAAADAAYVFEREKCLLQDAATNVATAKEAALVGVVIGETLLPLFADEITDELQRFHTNDRVRIRDVEGILKLFPREYRVEVER